MGIGFQIRIFGGLRRRLPTSLDCTSLSKSKLDIKIGGLNRNISTRLILLEVVTRSGTFSAFAELQLPTSLSTPIIKPENYVPVPDTT